MTNRLSKEALTTYIPAAPAVLAVPGYCVPNSVTIATLGVAGNTGVRTTAGSGFGSYRSTSDNNYYTVVLPPSNSAYNSGLQAEF
jgi:hypothetical protein